MAKAKLGYGRGTGTPHPVDVHVGARVRVRRTLRGMTQTDLGDALGLTFQQVQKYERGVNRVGSSRLYKLSQVLDVPINYFFDDMPSKVAAGSSAKGRGRTAEPVDYGYDPFARRETLSFVRSCYEIKNADVRQRVYEMTKTLGGASSSGD